MTGIKREPTGIRCKLENCEDGFIIKKTITERVHPGGDIRIGGYPPPTKEVITCYCNSCGTLYEPEVILKTVNSVPHP